MSRAAEYTESSGVFALYAHNDWRVRNNLTLNLGLRWEYESPLAEADDHMVSGFDFTTLGQTAGSFAGHWGVDLLMS